MNKTIFNALKGLSVVGVLAVGCVFAQSDHKIIANVPFDFVVMNKQMAAGTYDVTTDLVRSTVLLNGEENGSASFALSFTAVAGKTQEHAKLVFKRYGDRYFLSQVWSAGTDQGRELQTSKMEKELARNTGRPEIVALLASGAKPPKPVR